MRVSRHIIFVLFLVMLAGCTTMPVKDIFSIKGPRYCVDGCAYVSLDSVTRAYNVSSKWNYTDKKVTLSRGGIHAEFCIGSDIVVIGGVSYRLKTPVIVKRNTILLPRDFSESVLADFFMKEQALALAATEKLKAALPYHAIKKIVLDPGHGGKDPGAVSMSGLREKDIVLDIALRIKRYLETESIEVRLTRSDDTFVSLWRRADIANKYGADFFISIHANAAHSRYARGFEVFYLSEAVDDNARAVAAAENASLKYEDSSFGNTRPSSSLEATLWDIEYSENRRESTELAESITESVCGKLGLKNRGQKGANFYVLKGAKMPSVLVEVGFISNAQEARLLKDSSYRENVAKSITCGIINYKDEYEAAEGFTKQR